MKKETQLSMALWLVVTGIVLGLIALGVYRLAWQGIYSWTLCSREYHSMIWELACLSALLFACFFFLPSVRGRAVAAAVICGLFFWCHVVFLPVVIAGAYLVFLCALGNWMGRRLFCLKSEGGIGRDFLFGCSGILVLFCAMSAAGLGAIPNLRILTGIIAGGLLLLWIRSGRGRGMARLDGLSRWDWLFAGPLRKGMVVFILLMVLLQAGRMNISLDHDTLWYSVRSEYMLDNGPRGIYENMGTVSLVYTYSKGWEVLTLPLCDLPSHSFLLAFNLWLTVVVLYLGYSLAKCYMARERALFLPCLMAGVPGIMNLSISGKTDIITLLLQLIMLLEILRFIQDRSMERLMVSFGALLVSWTMKPTAIIFSTAVFGMSALYLLGEWLVIREGIRKMPRGAWAAGMLCFAALAGIWYRTYLFVGVPATSIFSGIFQRIGFQIRYPFLVWDLPEYGAKPTWTEEAGQLLKRLFGVFLLPEGEEMDRVLIAWCGLTILFFVLVWLCSLMVRGRTSLSRLERQRRAHCTMVLLPLIFVSIYSIYSLKKVDGNYFILLYTLVILYGCCRLLGIQDRRLRRGLGCLLLPLTLFGGFMISLSNLAWSVGFTPVRILNPGFYNHEALEHQAMAAKGNERIWQALASDPENRVIAFGSHPEVLAFPCNVQSYVDISSSSGNEQLIESTEAFREYLSYAKTDYIYVEAGNMAEEYLGYGLLEDCIREGILTDIWWENGNIIAVVDLEGEPGEEAVRNLSGFYENYQKKESH